MAKEEDLDELMSHLGEFGKYQWIQFLLHILAAFTAGMHMLSLVTVAPVPPHQCAPVSNSLTQNFTPAANEDGSISSCYLQDWTTNETMECHSWIYDTTYYKSSRAMEWNMVCDRRWMGAIGQSSYMFGVFTGAVILGTLADRYGRKTIFYISGILQLILGVGITFVNEYYTFLIISFFYGSFGSAGAYITGFVLSMELVGSSKRTACGVTFQATFATGIMMVALWAFVIHDRFYLQMIYGLHSLLLIGHWWLIDESPRWLWAQGRIKESVDIVAKGVKMNGGGDIDTAYYVSRGKATESRSKEATKAASIADMFKTPNLRLKTLNVSLNWFANSLVYYGLSLNVGSMFGNPHFMLFIMGLIEIPSYVLTVLFLDKTGRRCLTSSLMVIGGSACLLTAFLPEGEGWKTFGTSIVFLGKFCIAGSFAIIYNYSAELFPTVLRNTALGFGSMCARFSATLTPLITLLDSFDKRVPTVVFATVALVSGALTTLLPETLNQPMPQSIEDGETFGEGDTCFTTGCFGTKKRSPTQ